MKNKKQQKLTTEFGKPTGPGIMRNQHVNIQISDLAMDH